MMYLALVCALVGAVLGLRFTMLALVPVIGGALLLVVADDIATGNGFVRLTLTMITIVIAVQAGYIGGNVVRLVMGPARTPDHGGVSMPTSARMSGSA